MARREKITRVWFVWCATMGGKADASNPQLRYIDAKDGGAGAWITLAEPYMGRSRYMPKELERNGLYTSSSNAAVAFVMRVNAVRADAKQQLRNAGRWTRWIRRPFADLLHEAAPWRERR